MKRLATVVIMLCVFSELSCAQADNVLSEDNRAKIKQRYNELFPHASLDKVPDKKGAAQRSLTEKEIEGLKQNITDLQAIIRKFPHEKAWCAKTQNQIAGSYRDLREYETAIKEYEKVSVTYPDQKDACIAAQAGITACQKLMRDAQNKPAEEDAAKVAGPEKPVPTEAVAPVNPVGQELPAGAEYLFTLKSGKKIQGEIIKETNDSLTVRFAGNTIVYDKSDIQSYHKAE